MKPSILKLDGRKSFGLLTGINREILPKQVTKLSESIEKMGIIRPVVVCDASSVTGKKGVLSILDGQHLFHACIRMKRDIPYIIVNISSQEDLIEKIALLNSSSKSWSMSDYILAWSSVKEDYKKLMHYLNIYSFENRIVFSALLGTLHAGHSTGIIKSGNFQIKAEKFNKTLLDIMSDFKTKASVPIEPKIRNDFYYAFMAFYRKISVNYNHESFIKFLNSNKSTIKTSTNGEQFTNLFYKHIKP